MQLPILLVTSSPLLFSPLLSSLLSSPSFLPPPPSPFSALPLHFYLFLSIYVCHLIVFFYLDRVSLHSLSGLQTCDPSVSTSQILGLWYTLSHPTQIKLNDWSLPCLPMMLKESKGFRKKVGLKEM